MLHRPTWAALLSLVVAAPPCAVGTLQLPQVPAAPAEAATKADLRAAGGRHAAFEAGTSTLVDIIEGQRAGSRLRCTIVGRGALPDTYDVQLSLGSAGSRELKNVPSELLQQPWEAQGFKRLAADKGAEQDGDQGRSPEPQQEEQQQLSKAEDEDAGEADKAGDGKAAGADEALEEEDPVQQLLDERKEEEPQLLAKGYVRRLLGQAPPQQPQAAPPPPSPELLRRQRDEERRRKQEAADKRRDEAKRRAQATMSERKEQMKKLSASQASLRAKRKAYWYASQERLHFVVRDSRGSQLQFQAPRGTALRAVMVTAMERLGLAEAEVVGLLRNGTRLDPALTVAAVGLRDRDVLDLEQRLPAGQKAPAAAAALGRAPSAKAAVLRPPAAAAGPGVPAPSAEATPGTAGTAKEGRSTEVLWSETYKHKAAAKAGIDGSPPVDYEVGDFMEIKIERTVRRLDGGNWIPCTIVGKGSKPSTYNVHFPLAPNQQQDIQDVPASGLRMVEAQNWAQKIKRMRQDPEAAHEALAQAAREAEKRRRLKDLTTRLKGSAATVQRAEQAAQKRPLPPGSPGVERGVLPRPALHEKQTSLTKPTSLTRTRRH